MTSISAVRPALPTDADSAEVTRIDITPDASEQAFFGKDGADFGDLVDVINPLNHIPFLSELIGEKGDEKPAVAAKLAGGLLFGGPIGFVASLMNEIFTEATGHGFATTMVAALSGESLPSPEVQVAQAETALPATDAAESDQIALAAPIDAIEVASLDDTSRAMAADRYNDIASAAQANTATGTKAAASNRAALELYGNSAPVASRAYRKAQFAPFLKEANGRSQVL